jgi:hypothetical protein
MREPIESMRDALWEIERLEEKLEATEKLLAELKVEIDFERNLHQAEVNQLNDDIKFLRSKLPNL